jgi:hypothetical protein
LTCSYALKWVSHFLGDIAQPLHASGRAAGGNFYRVTFGNVSTELHAVWFVVPPSSHPDPHAEHTRDGYIPYTAANVSKPFSNETIAPFFENLVSRIRKDQFYSAPYMWLACSDPSTPVECATRWARESNKLTCDYVYSRVVNKTDLAESGYALGGVPIVELQVYFPQWTVTRRSTDKVQIDKQGGPATCDMAQQPGRRGQRCRSKWFRRRPAGSFDLALNQRGQSNDFVANMQRDYLENHPPPCLRCCKSTQAAGVILSAERHRVEP